MNPEPLRVLLVEDEALIAFNLELLVEELGFTVAGMAPDARRARELAEACPPDLAIVDVNLLDGRTGLDVAAHLASAFGTVVVIATGNADGIEPGGSIFAVVRKPYTDDALARVMRKAADAVAVRRTTAPFVHEWADGHT